MHTGVAASWVSTSMSICEFYFEEIKYSSLYNSSNRNQKIYFVAHNTHRLFELRRTKSK